MFADSPRFLSNQGEDIERLCIFRLGVDHPKCLEVIRLADACRCAETVYKDDRHPERLRLEEELSQAERDVESLIAPLRDAEMKQRVTAAWTSAIIETHPLAGAIVWPKDHLDNRMFCAEYGMPSCGVQICDIAEVKLMRNSEEVTSDGPEYISELLSMQRHTKVGISSYYLR